MKKLNLKKILSLSAAMALTLSLAACSAAPSGGDAASPSPSQSGGAQGQDGGAGVPHYTGADSFVRNGAFATSGVNYGDLGAYTADMTLDILQTGAVPEYHVMDGGIITVNTETAAVLGADYSVFSTLAGQVVEVQTTEE